MSRRQSCYINYYASRENSTQPTANKSKITYRLLINLLGAPGKKTREATLNISETACYLDTPTPPPPL